MLSLFIVAVAVAAPALQRCRNGITGILGPGPLGRPTSTAGSHGSSRQTAGCELAGRGAQGKPVPFRLFHRKICEVVGTGMCNS